jgi:forkhead transcription factor HCM1
MAKPTRFSGESPLHVFQDDYYQHSNSENMHPMHHAQKSRQPLQPTNQNAVLNPPSTYSANQSPFKSKSNSRMAGLLPRTPLKTKGGSKLNMVQMLPPTSYPTRVSTDSLTKKQPPMSRFKTVTQKPAPDFRVMQFGDKADSLAQIYPAPPPNPMKALGSFHFMEDKENAYLAPRPVSQDLNMTDESYQAKAGGKRQLLEAAPIREQRPVKKAKLDESEIPAHDAFPPIQDDGEKPGISYANLIGMAILRSPQRKLTLSQIYKWISDTFRWYNLEDAGWQNSIRHNLSLNKAFIKQERPKNDPGKGHYWSIEPGKEHQFMGKEKTTRKPVLSAENLPVMSTRLEPQPSLAQPNKIQPRQPTPTFEAAQQFQPRPASAHFQRPISRGPIQSQQQSTYQLLPALPQSTTRPSTAEMPPQLSSDATIVLPSDSATIEDVQDILDRADEEENENANDVNLYSPLPAAMHSSPPIPRHVDLGHGATPPRPVSQHHPSSRTNPRSHKRRIASMDDSGYISSLESSAMRPNPTAKMLTSEADRPSRIKRGRAEEEIARLRGSSYDSPTKVRPYGFAPPSSSPLRHNANEGQMLPPLTPAMKLKAPTKPPPSASPNTNLLRHRQNVQNMIESPFRRASQLPRLDASVQLTPGPKYDEFFYSINADLKGLGGTPFMEEFDIFADANTPSVCFNNLSPSRLFHGNGSPVKRSVKRPRLERPHSTSSLSGLKSGNSNPMASEFCRVPKQSPASKMMANYHDRLGQGSSSHLMALPSSPLKLFMQASPSKMPSFDVENMDPCADGAEPWFTLEDICDTERLLEEEDLDDYNGIDILGGFEKIGSGGNPLQNQLQPQQGQRTGRPSLGTPGKPGLGRSYSTNF